MLALSAAISAQIGPQPQPSTTMSLAPLTTAISTAAQDLEELKKQALISAENKKLREENAGLQQERDALIKQRDSAVSYAQWWETQSGRWETAATKRKEAITTGLTLDTNQQSDAGKAEAEIARTRALLDECRNPGFLKSLFKTDTLWKFSLGYGTRAAQDMFTK